MFNTHHADSQVSKWPPFYQNVKCYLKNHCTKHSNICIHFVAISILTPNMYMINNNSEVFDFLKINLNLFAFVVSISLKRVKPITWQHIVHLTVATINVQHFNLCCRCIVYYISDRVTVMFTVISRHLATSNIHEAG